MENELHAVHVQGPDDIFAVPSEADAIAVALHINNTLADLYVKPNAVAVPWPYSADEHADNMRLNWSELVPPESDKMLDWLQERAEEGCVTICFEMDGGMHVTLDPCGGEQRAARNLDSIRQGIARLMTPNVENHRTQASAACRRSGGLEC